MLKKIIVGIVAIALVLVGLFVIPTGSSEVSAPFGNWEVSILITDLNNDVIPLSIKSFQAQLFSVTHDDTDLSSITYTLDAAATGEGFTSCELDMTNAVIAADIDGSYFGSGSGNLSTLSIGGAFVNVFSLDVDICLIDSLQAGDYTIVFHIIEGDYRYRGLPGGEWQTSTSIPSAYLDIFVTDDTVCYRCDGNGGVDTMNVSSGEGCPPGWQDMEPSCECTTETSYGSWSSWQDTGCVSDCRMGQSRHRDKLERTCCPSADCTPWVKVGTDNDYRTVIDNGCCDDPDVTCYRCDGEGNVESRTFSGSCGSGWSSSPPDCDCTTTITYGDWGSWYFDHCEGRTRYDKRERTQTNAYCCPCGGCDYTYTTDYGERHYLDNLACGSMQITVPNLFYTVEPGSSFEPYRMDSTHYLGAII